MTIKSPLVFKLLAFGTILVFTGLFVKCTKPPTEAKITVQELITGAPVQGATVLLRVDSTEESGFFLCNTGFVNEQEYTTNSSGVIKACFELPALITVVATLPFGDSTLSMSGSGKLNLIEHETTNLTIKMN